jgi:N-acetylglutamate synthase-like GNAT family acetyltransferase
MSVLEPDIDAFREDFENMRYTDGLWLLDRYEEQQKALDAIRHLPHEDWCCAKGCAGEGFCAGCAGTEADCKCLVGELRAVIGDGDDT